MFTAINQDRALYDVLSSLDLSGQDVTTRWWITRDLREFRRAGVDRDERPGRRSARSPTSWWPSGRSSIATSPPT